VLVFSTLVTLVALFLSKIVKIKKGLGDKVSTGRSGSTAAHSSPNSSALQYTTSVQTETTKRRELELENQMLRERLSDLERQLLEKPKPIASSSSSSSD
jgi:cell shape-determining protein MreC